MNKESLKSFTDMTEKHNRNMQKVIDEMSRDLAEYGFSGKIDLSVKVLESKSGIEISNQISRPFYRGMV